MFNISQYLDKFKNAHTKAFLSKNGVISILLSVVGVKIERKDIDIRNGICFIVAQPMIKNQIYIKKQKILEELAKNADTRMIKDVK
jgi:hypothetical protein